MNQIDNGYYKIYMMLKIKLFRITESGSPLQKVLF